MIFLRALVFLFITVLTFQVSAQDFESSFDEDNSLEKSVSVYPPPNDQIEVPPFWDVLGNLPEDWTIFKNMVVAEENRPLLFQIGYITLLMVATDYETWQAFKRPHDNSRDLEVLNFHFVSMGDGYFQFALAGAFGAYGGLADDNLALRTAHQVVEVILSTGAVVQLMKHITGREAPLRTTTRTGNWEPFPEQSKYHRNVQKYDAVPSGHTATFYATFKVIEDNYRHVEWIPWVGYPLTFGVAAGLVGTSLHWWSDIPIAIALGHSFAKIVTRNNHADNRINMRKYQDNQARLVPMFTPRGETLLGVAWNW